MGNNNIIAASYSTEQQKLEERYGCVIAQFICDELEKTEQLNQRQKEKQAAESFAPHTFFFRAA
ncbi:MAG: hypothetical protein H6857_02600 [Rhodospirillales bacterium]|nr:hypothetical protein [Rhodospirillales bacterium]MCB9980704.1 hypothetical protein [Rhodospirillales bacterium]